MLEAPAALVTGTALAHWRARVQQMVQRLGWPEGSIVARCHATGATLAFEAPMTCLLTATEVNECAWLGALAPDDRGPPQLGPAHPAEGVDAAEPLLRQLARAEAPPHLDALLAERATRGVPLMVDDEAVTIGAGARSRTWPLADLPAAAAVPWAQLGDVPVALVTGSNGKTTTVRLLAAMCVANGWVTAQSGTDGVRVADAMLAEGDWAGPAGARLALRDVRTEAAVLETARGGMLRRGLAVAGARTAIVTNVQADHFGEYGVDDLQALAAVKLVLAKGLAADGILVLNGDDPVLRAAAANRSGRTAWFSLDADAPCIAAGRASGAPVAWRASDGVLRLSADGTEWTLGAERDLPLAAGGIAGFNVSNMLAASLGAWGMGIAPSTIAAVLATFGAARGDNPGRLMRWQIAGATVLLDYAHNPDGLTALLAVAESLRGRNGRLLLLLGQAGNRDDDSIRALARAAAAAKPALIALKELPDFLRGRALGEVPRLLDAALRDEGQAAASIGLHEDETAAAQALAMQARAGDVVVLPVHGRAARTAVIEWLDARERSLPAP